MVEDPVGPLKERRQFIAWFRGYLLVVTSDPRKPNKNVFNIYDLKNKFIAYSTSVGEVGHILCEWGTITLLTEDQRVLCIGEKDMGSKLDMLFRKNLYTIAINLVSANPSATSLLLGMFS